MGPLGKCATCLDTAVMQAANGDDDARLLARIPDAVVSVTILGQFGQVQAPSQIAVCLPCRRAQVRPLSRSGLLTP